MKRLINNFLRPKSQIELGNNLFLIGVFFLPSALPLSAIFLIISLAISLKERKLFLLKDVYNYLLFIAIGLILFSTINISFINVPSALLKYETIDQDQISDIMAGALPRDKSDDNDQDKTKKTKVSSSSKPIEGT